jgi:serine/threonine-protein kinase
MKLRHPGIVRAFDFGVEQGRMYLAMTLVRGETLETMVTPSLRLGEDAAIDVTEAVARTLAAMHRQQIVHRDIKPGNILIEEGGRRPMLFDLGAAIDLNRDHPEVGEVYGTPAYASPEQARGDATIDGRADIYSLGVTLYRIVAARKPFYGSRLDLLQAHVEAPPPRPSKFAYITPDLEAVIMKALEKDPADRYQDAEAMADALRAAKARIGTSPPPLTSRIRDWMVGPATREV